MTTPHASRFSKFTPYPLDSRYGVSEDGRVCCYVWMSNWPPRICRQYLQKRGYLTVCVDSKNTPVHQMVAMTFIPNPQNKQEIAHNNGVRTDNRRSNLRWATPKENSDDKFRHGTLLFGDRHPGRKLSQQDVNEIREIFVGKVMYEPPFYYEVAEQYGVTRRCISMIVKNDRWIYDAA